MSSNTPHDIDVTTHDDVSNASESAHLVGADPTSTPPRGAKYTRSLSTPSTAESTERPSPFRGAAQELFRDGWNLLSRTWWGVELQLLLPVCLPIMSQGALTQLLSIADLFFVGTVLGPEYLAAAALGNAYFNMLSSGYLGVAQAIDHACSESMSRGVPIQLGMHLQRGLVLMAAVTIPLVTALSATDTVLVVLFGQNVELSETASGFCDSLKLGLLPLCLSTAVTRYLWAQGIIWPALGVDVLSNLLNVSLNALLINVDGFLGAPLATSVSRIAQLLLFTFYMLRWRPHVSKGTWAGWSFVPAVSDGKEMVSLGMAAVTGTVSIAMETWPTEVSILMAGRLAVPQLDAHCVLINTVLFCSLMVPTGLGAAAAVRIRKLLAAGDGRAAQRTAFVSISATLCFSLMVACVLLAIRGRMGDIFTSNREVTAQISSVTTLAALYQVLDGGQVVMGGILRGLGYDRGVTLMVFALKAVLALPLGATLGLTIGWGLPGLWVGLLAGAACLGAAFGAALYTIDWPSAATAPSSASASLSSPKKQAAVENFNTETDDDVEAGGGLLVEAGGVGLEQETSTVRTSPSLIRQGSLRPRLSASSASGLSLIHSLRRGSLVSGLEPPSEAANSA